MKTTDMHQAAFHAIKAADIYRRCGRYAARQYAAKHGVLALYVLARQLSAVSA